MRKFVFCITALLATLGSFAQAQDQGYNVYRVADKRPVGLADIVKGVSPGEVLVFGEEHDDSIGHRLEALLFEELYARFGEKTMLSLEMFHRDVQYVLDEYLKGLISEKNFIKEARAWDTYKTDYRPLIEWAKEKGLTVVAANTPSRYVNRVTRLGLSSLKDLDAGTRKAFLPPLPIDTMTGNYYARFLEAMGGHEMPGMHLYQSQNLWDATMSWSIAKAMKANKGKVMLMLNGKFHSDYKEGFVHRLVKDYKVKVKTISCVGVSDPSDMDWKRYAPLADYVILTKKAEKAE